MWQIKWDRRRHTETGQWRNLRVNCENPEERMRRQKATREGKRKWRVGEERGRKKVSSQLVHVTKGKKKKNTGEKLQVTDQPQSLIETCISMLLVGMCDSTSVHTPAFLAGSEDLCLDHQEIWELKPEGELLTDKPFYFPENFHLFISDQNQTQQRWCRGNQY